ncbi:MAG: hypothetical protein RLZZ200_2594, partial [Pseudomonadota bacterium]
MATFFPNQAPGDYLAALNALASAQGIVWKGAWNSGTAYVIGDGVFVGSTAYICTAANTNHTPPNASYWNYLNSSVYYAGAWVTSTTYPVGAIVKDAAGTQNIYYVVTEHTSGVLATDIAAGRLVLWVDNSTATTQAASATASATLASQWATTTGALVAATDYSSKEWAVGTFTRGSSGKGSAKDWATYTAATVDNAGYSAKEWATGTQTRGASSGGSSKDWATYTGGTVDNAGYSAKHWSDQAQTWAQSLNPSNVLTVAGGTDGSVVFINGAGAAAQDNANFFWDRTNHRLGIGNAAPTVPLDVTGAIKGSTTVTAASFIPSGSTVPTNGMYLSAANTLALAT